MSEARVGGSPAATSGATNPGSPPGATPSPVEAIPKSTTTIRPCSVRTRLAGLTSPWTTGGSCPCKNVRASAAWASERRTVEGGSPGVPCSARRPPRSVPSIQSITMTYSSSWKKSSRTSGRPACGSRERRIRASRRSSPRADPVGAIGSSGPPAGRAAGRERAAHALRLPNRPPRGARNGCRGARSSSRISRWTKVAQLDRPAGDRRVCELDASCVRRARRRRT